MKTVMYIFLNKGARMSTGKAAAQSAHAAVEAYRISKPELIKEWYSGKHYTKIVLGADNEEHLKTIERYINERGFKTALIIDEGLTEVDPHTVTALGVEVVDREDKHVDDTFGSFSLYRDTVRITLEVDR